MEYGQKTVFGTIVPDCIVDLYNKYTEEINRYENRMKETGSMAYIDYLETIKDNRFKLLNEYCNPNSPLQVK